MKLFGFHAFVLSSALPLLALLTSCSRIEFAPAAIGGCNMTLTATIVDTKTSNEGVNTFWSSGDKASLIHCQSGGSTYYRSCFTYCGDDTFSGNVTDKSELNDWYFVYPYSQANTRADDISVYVDPNPIQSTNGSTAHLCGEAFPLFGVLRSVPSSQDVDFSMSNSLAVGKIVITNAMDEPVSVSKIKFASSEPISGDFTVDLTSGSPVWTPGQGAGNSVSLTVTDGSPIDCGESATFYFGFVPHESSQMSVTVTATTADGQIVKYYVNRQNSALDKYKAGLFKVMRLNFDDSHPVPVNFVKVMQAQTDWSGTYLFVDESVSKAFAALSGVSGYAADVVIKDGKIASDGKIDRYALNVTSTGKTHPAINNSAAYDVCNSDGKYVYWSSNMGGVVLDDNNIYEKHPSNSKKDTQYGHCFEYSGSGVKVMSAGFNSGFTTYYLQYSSGSFLYGKSSATVQLYRLDGQNRLSQSLSFPLGEITWKVGSEYELSGTYDLQRVLGAKTPVTYSSEDTDVVTVSGNRVTINGYGSATITASARSDDEYYAASASYTLKISKEGVYNLENTYVKSYLDAAQQLYTDSNYKTITIVTQYCLDQSATNRKDIPAPVTLSWSSSSSSVRKVTVFNDASMTDTQMTASTSSNTIDIYNLIPGRTYWYKVSTDAEGVIASGKFETEGRIRMLLVSNTRAKGHANNCRDFGGLNTTDGKKLKHGIIFRGSNMDMTTDAERSILLDYMNIGIDIDLRSETPYSTSEGEDGLAVANNPWTGSLADRVEYCNDCVCTGSFSSDFKVGLKEKNANFTKMFTKLLAKIRSGKAAYIHCHVGADRTGYVCLILEMVLGVSPKDCSIDFELTSFSVTGTRLRTGDSSHNICKDALNYINDYKGDTYKDKAYNILTGYGITDAQIQEFRSIMLE